MENRIYQTGSSIIIKDPLSNNHCCVGEKTPGMMLTTKIDELYLQKLNEK